IFDAPFFDETIAAYYQSEAIALKLFKTFAALGIFISCLGLYGLVSFMTFQKNKEVGIRKVLGASSRSVVLLFSGEFTVLIIVSFLISAPVSYYFMNRWLATFYYHTNISWGVFAIALILSILIAWVTVGYKAVKAAIANPVKSLRSE
ncbi:MAG TPA: FtsX-like permease family protein, partial [Flavitalea sp.]|nr:FtsX-like permease family protein [Flavitalea sp.]